MQNATLLPGISLPPHLAKCGLSSICKGRMDNPEQVNFRIIWHGLSALFGLAVLVRGGGGATSGDILFVS
jgi:hypothetical protein